MANLHRQQDIGETPVTRFFREKGIPFQRIVHERAAPTAQDVADMAGIRLGQVVKSMALESREGPYVMALVPGDRRLDFRLVSRRTGLRLSMMAPEKVPIFTGYRVGYVAPFALKVNPAYLVADESLFTCDLINVSAGHPRVTCNVNPEHLVPLITGGIFPLCRSASQRP